MGEKKGSIKIKILGITFLVTVILFIVLGFLINDRVGSQLENEAQVKLSKDSEIISKEIDLFFSKYGMLVEQMTKNPDIINIAIEYKNREEKRQIPDFDKIVNIFQDIKSTDSSIGLVWMGSSITNDLITDIYEYDSPEDYVITGRSWYKQMLENNGLTYTDPYIDGVTGEIVISIVAPIYDGSNIIGNVGIDLSINEISNFISSYDIGENGYSILISSVGTIVYHPDETQIMNVNMTNLDGKIGTLAKEMVEGKLGIDQYDDNGINNYFAYAPIKSSGWSVGTIVPIEETNKIIDKFIFMNTSMFIGVIVILLIVIFFTISNSLKNVPALVDNMNIFSKGDLTHDLDINSIDEIGQISKAYNNAVKSLRIVIKNALKSSDDVNIASSMLVRISDESKQALNEVSIAINEVTNGTSDQAFQTEQSVSSIHELSKEIGNIINRTEDIYKKTEEMHELSINGASTIQDLNDQSKANQESVKTIKEIVKDMDSSSNEISTIVDIINSISQQTNLLALNASIEAARAGDAGRGFAVVADEIRKLAEQTNEATEEIRKKISDIQGKSAIAVVQTENSEEIVNKNVEIVSNTGRIFNNILENISSLFEISEKSKLAAREMDHKKEEIVNFIETVSAASQETSASMEEMSATTEEQLSIMDNLAGEAKKLSELAGELHKILENFKV